MDEKKPQPPQASVLLRVLGGGYLAYLAYDLLKSGSRDPLILCGAVVFGIVGGVLIFFNARSLITNEYFYTKSESEENEEAEEESDPAE